MGTYIRLVDYKSHTEKEQEFFDPKNYSVCTENEYRRIDGVPFAYWISGKLRKMFEEEESLGRALNPRVGLQTGSNDLFLRLWYEVDNNLIGLGFNSKEDAAKSKLRWFPYNKGGNFRRWYGNRDYIVNWENDGYAIKNNYDVNGKLKSRPQNKDYYFQTSLTWADITPGSFAARYCEAGFMFDVKGSSGFPLTCNMKYMLGFLNSPVIWYCIKVLNPTMTTQVGDLSRVPFVVGDMKTYIDGLVEDNICLSKNDWDDYEVSWGFKKHPLLEGDKKMGRLISDKFNEYERKTNERFSKLKENEKKINEYFVSLYGLEDELESDVNEDEVSIRKANLEREIKSLISYAIGCIMGRYSLSEDGLVYAGGSWDATRYPADFRPCEYGVMLITEDQYFEEDLCTRVIDFIEYVYGKDTLKENLDFIAQALKPGAKESARQVLRNYLYSEKGFFDNHYQIYQHRPIYWMLSSGKSGGFRALVYMHRYNQNTLSIVRSDLLHELRYKYEADQSLQHKKEVEAATTADRNEAKKKIAALDKKLVEINQYDDLINHATGNITAFTFDLDDGVKNNYSKFIHIDGVKTQNLLVPIKL